MKETRGKPTSSRAVGDGFHDRVRDILFQSGFVIERSDHNEVGPDIIASFKGIRIIIQCRKGSPQRHLKGLPDLIDSYRTKISTYKADLAILAVSGYKVSLKSSTSKVKIWDDKIIDYYEDISKKIGEYAGYQILSELGLQKVFGDQIKVPAIKLIQNDYSFYLTAINSGWLLKSSFVLRHFRSEDIKNYQRLLDKDRVKKEIPHFLQKEIGILPNNIICVSRSHLKFSANELTLDSKTGQFWVMDGQHRLYSFANIAKKKFKSYPLPCVIFEEKKIDSKNQAELFVNINDKAKTVSPALLLELEDSLGLRTVSTAVVLKLRRSALFKERIKMYSEKKTKLKSISFVTFATSQAGRQIFSEKSQLFKRLKTEPSQIRKGVQLYSKYFSALSSVFKTQWLDSKVYIFSTDKGIRSLLHLLRIVIEKNPQRYSEKAYFEALFKALKKSDSEVKNSELKGQFAGEAGALKLAERWARAIQEIDPELTLIEEESGDESIREVWIENGEQKKANDTLANWFARLRGEVIGRINYVDARTLDYLSSSLSKNVNTVKLLVDVVRGEQEEFRTKVEELNRKGWRIQIIEENVVDREGGGKRYPVTHGRWIGDNVYWINLETDLDPSSIAGRDHMKTLYKWGKSSVRRDKFDQDWGSLARRKGRKLEHYGF